MVMHVHSYRLTIPPKPPPASQQATSNPDCYHLRPHSADDEYDDMSAFAPAGAQAQSSRSFGGSRLGEGLTGARSLGLVFALWVVVPLNYLSLAPPFPGPLVHDLESYQGFSLHVQRF